MPVDFLADLHIHTCLSPCADLSMSPRAIVERAASQGINIIAICDHNSAENTAVTRELARAKGITALAGMEITSAEEVHLLGLFPDDAAARAVQGTVYENLQPGENDENAFGMQVVVNAHDEVLGFNKRLLIGSTSLPVEAVVNLIHSAGGLAVASHIDREGFGIIGQLGFIPEDIPFDALEISRRVSPGEAEDRFGRYRSIPWIISSDAHSIDEVGAGTTTLSLYHATFEEIRLALRGEAGRKVTITR